MKKEEKEDLREYKERLGRPELVESHPWLNIQMRARRRAWEASKGEGLSSMKRGDGEDVQENL